MVTRRAYPVKAFGVADASEGERQRARASAHASAHASANAHADTDIDVDVNATPPAESARRTPTISALAAARSHQKTQRWVLPSIGASQMGRFMREYWVFSERR